MVSASPPAFSCPRLRRSTTSVIAVPNCKSRAYSRAQDQCLPARPPQGRGGKLVISGRCPCGRNTRDDHDRLSQRIFVGQGKVDLGGEAGRRDFLQAGERAPGQHQGRLAAAQIDHPHVAPEHAAPQAGAERLGASLLGGEALGVARGTRRAALGAPLLDLGEDAPDEALAEALQRFLDAADVAEIVADAQDHAEPVRAWSMMRRISRIAASSPTKIASPTRKWPILSSRTSGMAATGATSA